MRDQRIRDHLLARVHELRHAGRTYRQIVDAVAAEGFQISVGTCCSYMQRTTCAECDGGAS
jgi:hypothetical protein